MIRISDKSKCCGCTACYAVCPHDAIIMKPDALGFMYPEVDMEVCVDCGLCERVCPHPKEYPEANPLKVYAAFNKDNDVRMNSSSGGVFPVAAQNIFEGGGTVYGAAFSDNDDGEVVHVQAGDMEAIRPLCGSKYVQSDMHDTFRMIRSQVRQGRTVLFTGTPCQVAGLESFFVTKPDNLYTMSCACHGVPSPSVWRRYYKEIRGSSSVVSFRDKGKGWKGYDVRIGDYTSPAFKDPYMKAMLKGITLRPSCVSCPYKGRAFGSDLLVGDWWGIGKIMPELDDDRGTSAVIVNTGKGLELLRDDSLALKEMPGLEDPGNKGFNSSVFEGYDSESLAKKLSCNQSVYDMLERMTAVPLKKKISGRIKKLLRR